LRDESHETQRGPSDKNMSRIFDALKRAQQGKVQPGAPLEGSVEIPDRRRSRRWSLDVSVYVYGHGMDKEPFHEEARTLQVNANGALLLLSAPVTEGQTLLLTHKVTEKEQDCRVVSLRTRSTSTVEAGVAFPLMNPEFWNLSAEPENEPTA